MLVLEVSPRLSMLRLVERRLRDEQVAAFDEFLHLAVEEGQQERPDVAAVDVGIAHQDDPVIAELGDVKVVGPHAGAERRDDVPYFLESERLVEPRLLDVEDLALEGQDRLEDSVAPLLGRSAR